jgi:hypothetical protein
MESHNSTQGLEAIFGAADFNLPYTPEQEG